MLYPVFFKNKNFLLLLFRLLILLDVDSMHFFTILYYV